MVQEFPGIQIISAPSKPSDWHAKTGPATLDRNHPQLIGSPFADADTVIPHQSLESVVRYMSEENLDMASCIPFHTCRQKWEKWLGPFYAMVIATTGVMSDFRFDRPFAVGQFLVLETHFIERSVATAP